MSIGKCERRFWGGKADGRDRLGVQINVGEGDGEFSFNESGLVAGGAEWGGWLGRFSGGRGCGWADEWV